MSSWALVTGATSGIGESFTRLLASHNYNVVLVARDLPRLKERAAALEAKFAISTHVIQADLATDDGCLRIENTSKTIRLMFSSIMLGLGPIKHLRCRL